MVENLHYLLFFWIFFEENQIEKLLKKSMIKGKSPKISTKIIYIIQKYGEKQENIDNMENGIYNLNNKITL